MSWYLQLRNVPDYAKLSDISYYILPTYQSVRNSNPSIYTYISTWCGSHSFNKTPMVWFRYRWNDPLSVDFLLCNVSFNKTPMVWFRYRWNDPLSVDFLLCNVNPSRWWYYKCQIVTFLYRALTILENIAVNLMWFSSVVVASCVVMGALASVVVCPKQYTISHLQKVETLLSGIYLVVSTT